jgi:ribulose-5-phosphate 4-epimerase/fuculose-1-phosphate aldolase
MTSSIGTVRTASLMTEAEWQTRVDLAAAYRLVAMNGWVDGTATHISARIPGEEAFLLNPYGMLFSEVTASNLVKIDIEGNILRESAYPINPAGFVVHSAVHMARPDAGCVMHLHTDEGIAVSCLAEGLLPLNQTAMLVADFLAYHEYEGVSLEFGERERLGANLGKRNLMILRNHGTLTLGVNVGEAYCRMALLQRACAIQVMILSMGRAIQPTAPEARARSSEVGKRIAVPATDFMWAAHRRQLDRLTTDYKQ